MAARETRRHIVEVADRLFYERGFDTTSLADIAGETGLSRGNFYYHFRTKDEILEDVIALRMANTQTMLRAWAQDAASPLERIDRFVRMLVENRTKIMAHGCPVGTLCNELAKLDHASKDRAAGLFSLFRTWLAEQFALLGRQAEADALALHLLMRSQGVATLATAFGDEEFLCREVADMETWLRAQAAATPSPRSQSRKKGRP